MRFLTVAICSLSADLKRVLKCFVLTWMFKCFCTDTFLRTFFEEGGGGSSLLMMWSSRRSCYWWDILTQHHFESVDYGSHYKLKALFLQSERYAEMERDHEEECDHLHSIISEKENALNAANAECVNVRSIHCEMVVIFEWKIGGDYCWRLPENMKFRCKWHIHLYYAGLLKHWFRPINYIPFLLLRIKLWAWEKTNLAAFSKDFSQQIRILMWSHSDAFQRMQRLVVANACCLELLFRVLAMSYALCASGNLW